MKNKTIFSLDIYTHSQNKYMLNNRLDCLGSEM